ncbi:hypothetical protein K9N50_12360 [bacterium]|nr:hypothetical protein [bacterium]
MRNIRFRFRILPGKSGKITPKELGEVLRNTQEFLKDFNDDTDIDLSDRQWYVDNLHSSAPTMDVVMDVIDEDEISTILTKAKDIIYGRVNPCSKVVESFQNIPTPLRNGSLEFGISTNGSLIDDSFEWSEIVQSTIEKIVNEPETDIEYYGTVRGRLVSWLKKESKISIKELLDDDIVYCTYRKEQYDKVHKLFEEPDSIVIIAGDVLFDMNERKIKRVKADMFSIAPEYREGDLEEFLGCIPNITNGLSASKYIDNIRGEDNE